MSIKNKALLLFIPVLPIMLMILTDKKQLSFFLLCIVPILIGIAYECFRLLGSIDKLFEKAPYILLISFFALLPSKHEISYNIYEHIGEWQISIALITPIIIAADLYLKKRVVIPLTEGSTLVYTLVFNYWFYENIGVIDNNFKIFLVSIIILFSLYAVMNALTYAPLSKINRIILSVWNTVIMLFLSIFFVIMTLSGTNLKKLSIIITNCNTLALFVLKYFFVGTALIYIVYNLLMITNFLPNPRGFTIKRYKSDLHNVASQHLARYDDRQTHVITSFLLIILSCSILFININYRLLPPSLVIWFILFLFSIYDLTSRRYMQ
ncbi:MAG: hypothetical protein KBH06_06775 [Spirochaetes bacterium]|nr:hypothetical protein [Spirochaetota bacterium]